MRWAARLGTGVLLLVAGVALAPSAAAVDDTSRPDYTVTQGPSCHPGGVQIRVVAGTVPYSVVLATTRQPGGEDSADLTPGETVLLHTGDVDWGETIDSRLEFTALDGSGDTFSDELVPYSFTRPSQEDCAAIAPPLASGTAAPATVPGTAPTQPADTAPADVAQGSTPAPAGSDGDAPSAPGPEDGIAGAPQGLDLQVEVAATQLPVAPVTRPPDWALIAAGVSLVGSAGGLVLVAAGRGRRDTP